jgi:hypothetical protein
MHDGLKKRNFSAVELIEAHIDAVENEELNAFIKKTPEIAMKAAKVADEYFSRQKDDLISPLMGIPVGIKDLFCTKGIKTTACSRMLENFVPTYESTVSDLLLKVEQPCSVSLIWMNLLWVLRTPIAILVLLKMCGLEKVTKKKLFLVDHLVDLQHRLLDFYALER